MKKLLLFFITFTLISLICCSCSQSGNDKNTPKDAVDSFLQAVQKQDYSTTEAYYSENMDNMANFRNQIEVISPHVANELFNKMADFTYTIDNVTIDSTDANKAIVNTTITAYDLGKSFEQTVLDYIKSDIEMTFEGAKNEDIIKSVEDTLVKEITQVQKQFTSTVTIPVSKKDGTWEIDKIDNNSDLVNALSGNIINTINTLSKQLNATS